MYVCMYVCMDMYIEAQRSTKVALRRSALAPSPPIKSFPTKSP